ncbi:hypothetical protein H0H92_012120 [Tricholoma furcatifolium]|nr:hypothetical protein H0H92_012120 [Tricholoma furcatifolium]
MPACQEVMTTARTSEPRSLLHSRSLRDLHTPPRQEKSRGYILPINKPRVTHGNSSPIPSMNKPSYVQAVHTPQDQRRESPASLHVSPFISASRSNDAGTLSRTSSYGTPPRPSARPSVLPGGQCVQELRNPPVDPRKHRRLCNDFGLDRTDQRTSPSISSSVPDISSLSSTPLAVYEETESDTDTSVNQVLESSFPQPPPIHETMHLRRMRSSPMFNAAEKELMAYSVKKRWGVQGSHILHEHWDGTTNVSSDSRYTYGIEDSSIIQPTKSRVTEDCSPRPRVREHTLSLTSSTLRRPDFSAPPLSLRQREQKDWKRATTTFMPDNAAPRSPSRPATAPKSVTPLHTEISRSMDLLESSIEKLKRHDPQNQRKVAPAGSIEPKMSSPLNPPSLAQAGRKKPLHRSHVSTPAFRVSELSGRYPLSPTPLLHNHLGSPSESGALKRGQPLASLEVPRESRLPTPKSFMDITPERVDPGVKKGSRVRSVRKLIARASVGMFGWRKNLNKTKNMP